MRNIRNIHIKPIYRSHLSLAFASLLLVLSLNVRADHNVHQDYQGEVIFGYDTVAYFTMGKAVKGSKDISVEWLGGKWLFANEKHRKLFLADQGKYIPQYGGYCSVDTIFGSHSNPDPKAWRIVDGKLYLFADKATLNAWGIGNSLTQAADKMWEKARAVLLQQ